MIEIKDYKDVTLLQLLDGDDSGAGTSATPLNEGSVHHCELMTSDYLQLKFNLATPILFSRGCYAVSEGEKFILRSNYHPSYDTNTGAYVYDMQLDAWYYDLERLKMRLNPICGARETSFSLTVYPEDHFKTWLQALRYANLNIYSGTPSMTYAAYMAQTGATEDGYKQALADAGCIEISCNIQYKTSTEITNRVENRAYLVEYSDISLLEAINQMCSENAFNCEWWFEGAVLNFGRCEYHKDSPIDLELGTSLQSISQYQSSSDYATRVIGFGATTNVPSRYRKSLSFTVTEVKEQTIETATEFTVSTNIEADVPAVTSSKQGVVGTSLTQDIGTVTLKAGTVKFRLAYTVNISSLVGGSVQLLLNDGTNDIDIGSASTTSNVVALDKTVTFTVAEQTTYTVKVNVSVSGNTVKTGDTYVYQPSITLGAAGGNGSYSYSTTTGKYLVRDATRKMYPKYFYESARIYKDAKKYTNPGWTGYSSATATSFVMALANKFKTNGGRRFRAAATLSVYSKCGSSYNVYFRVYDINGDVIGETLMASGTINDQGGHTLILQGDAYVSASEDAEYIVAELEGTFKTINASITNSCVVHQTITMSSEDYEVKTSITAGGASVDAYVNDAFQNVNGDDAAWLLVDSSIPVGTAFTLSNVMRGSVPLSYFTDDYPKDTTIVDTKRRLLLPVSTCPKNYIDAETIKDSDGNTIESKVVEKIVELDSVYPSKTIEVAKVGTYTSTETDPDDETGISTITYTHYRVYVLKSAFTFSNDYRQSGEPLQAVFQTGKLAGMTFDVDFEGNCTGDMADYQAYVIALNQDYGVTLPNTTLYPAETDQFVLIGYDTSYLSDEGNTLLAEAENRLEKELRARLEILAKENITYNVILASDFAYGVSDGGVLNSEYAQKYSLGRCVNLIDAGLGTISSYVQVIGGYLYDAAGNPLYDAEGRPLSINYSRDRIDYVLSRIIGYETKLDVPYDSPMYIVGESQAYSRLATMEKQITK